MASGPSGRAEEEPPALPIKQHRSHSSRCSSVEHDCALPSPVELQSCTYNEVFPEPTDCHAAQCPIHQRYDPAQHQLRFFSDGTPPPVPKKRLARTLSLPVTQVPPLSPLSPPSPLSPLRRPPQDFDNPLYMLMPVRASCFTEEAEESDTFTGSSVPSVSFSQLSFDTPDEHLPYIFSSFGDQSAILQAIQHRHLLFLRSMAQSVDAGILLQDDHREKEVNSYLPQDFVLHEGSEAKQVGDAVYYRLHSPKFPGRLLALRVCKHTDESSSAHTKHLPPHVNVQDVVAYFHPRDVMRSDSNNAFPMQLGCTATRPPGEVTSERTVDHELASVQSFLQRGYPVSVERDLPLFTLDDFVHSGNLLQSSDYERQVCELMLQVLISLAHLYDHSGSASELRPREIFLVWPHTGEEEERNGGLREVSEYEEMKRSAKIQMLWRTHGWPRVVLIPVSCGRNVPHTLIYIKSQIRALIQFCLQPHDSTTSLGSGPAPSSHRKGLLYLASRLQSEGNGPQLEHMVATLQVLIWGPRIPLFDPRNHVTMCVHNWLTVKRALFVMRLAERGLAQDQRALSWEDMMCLKYLSFVDSEAVVSITSQLWLKLNVD